MKTTPKSSRSLIAAADVPIEAWLSKTLEVLLKRLEKNGLTAESLTQDGNTLGERVVADSVRFQSGMQVSPQQDQKLIAILHTCKDPRSKAAIWLRALLPWVPNNSLSMEEQLDMLATSLPEKVEGLAPQTKLKWATLALSAGDELCKKYRLEPGQQEAAERLLAAAWNAMPEDLAYEGKSMLPGASEWGDKTPWGKFRLHVINMMRSFSNSDPTPAAILPLQLWMLPSFQTLTINDQVVARENMGLVPYSHIGHRPFILAVQQGTPWPIDPRVEVVMDWLDRHNPLVAEVVRPIFEQSLLNVSTVQAPPAARKARL